MPKISPLLVAGIVLLFGANTLAQDMPTSFEVGVDYSLSHFIPALTGSQAHNLSGGGGSIVYYTPMKWLGVKMDLQGYASTTSTFTIPIGTPLVPKGGILNVQGNLFTYMFGPVIKKRGKIEPYGQVLVGGAYTNVYGNLFTAAAALGKSPNTNALCPDQWSWNRYSRQPRNISETGGGGISADSLLKPILRWREK